MSTRSVIAQKNGTDYTAIYCHWDGKDVGTILRKHYKTRAIISDLMELGDLSSLAPTLDDTMAYGRDRGELGTGSQRYTFLQLVRYAQDVDAEYLYIFDRTWHGYTL